MCFFLYVLLCLSPSLSLHLSDISTSLVLNTLALFLSLSYLSIVCPSSMTLSTDLGVNYSTVTSLTANVSDNFDIDLFAECSGIPLMDQFPLGVTTVTCSVSDSASNSASCSLTVTVQDTEPPVLPQPCLSTLLYPTDPASALGTVTWTPPTPTDNVNVASFNCSHTPGDTFSLGLTTVSCNAYDDNDLSAMCTFNIRIQDGESPMYALPPSLSLSPLLLSILLFIFISLLSSSSFCSPCSIHLSPLCLSLSLSQRQLSS